MTSETWEFGGPSWAYLKAMQEHSLKVYSYSKKIPDGMKFSLALLDDALEKLIEIEKHADKNGKIKLDK